MSGRRRLGAHLPGAVARARGKLVLLDWRERLLLAEAPVALPLVALALRRWGVRDLQRQLVRRASAVPAALGPDERRALADRLAWCVQAAAAHGPWPANCLQRSLVLWWFLRRRGLRGDLRIGVRPDATTGQPEFHAWVEYEGSVLNDTPDVRERYATFDAAIAPRDGSFR